MNLISHDKSNAICLTSKSLDQIVIWVKKKGSEEKLKAHRDSSLFAPFPSTHHILNIEKI